MTVKSSALPKGASKPATVCLPHKLRVQVQPLSISTRAFPKHHHHTHTRARARVCTTTTRVAHPAFAVGAARLSWWACAAAVAFVDVLAQQLQKQNRAGVHERSKKLCRWRSRPGRGCRAAGPLSTAQLTMVVQGCLLVVGWLQLSYHPVRSTATFSVT